MAQSNNTESRAFAVHVAELSLTPVILYVPLSLLGVISELTARKNPWELLSMAEKFKKNHKNKKNVEKKPL